jgi:hypothetical protein
MIAAVANDDWRLHVRVHGHGLARGLSERLEAADLEHDLERAFEDKVIVSVDGPDLYVYTGSREQADAAAKLLRELEGDREIELSLQRWHPSAQAWEDPDVPIPQSDADELVERAQRIERERVESQERGYPEYEVRVECASRDDATVLAENLLGQGFPVVHRDRYLVLGATDEDSAAALAEHIRSLVPEGATVTVEASRQAVEDAVGPNPFAIFGGLGG